MAFRLRPDRPLGREIQRIAEEELTGVISGLSDSGKDLHRAVHESRRAFKRLRGLMRLVQAADREPLRNARFAFGKIARSLSSLRDAAAKVESCRKLEPYALTDHQAEALAQTIDHLTQKRDALLSPALDIAGIVAAAIADSRKQRSLLQQWQQDIGPGRAARIIRKGWRKTLERGHLAFEECSRGNDIEQVHELRKACQTHIQHLLLLNDLWPSVLDQRRLQAKALADLLGEDHDLDVLATTIGEDAAMPPSASTLLPSLQERQLQLRQRALLLAKPLFALDPAFEASRIARLWRMDARDPD